MWILTCVKAIWFIWRSGSTRAPNELERSHKKEKEFRLGDFFGFLLNGIKFLACFGNCKVEDPHLLKYKGSGSFGDLVEPERQMNQTGSQRIMGDWGTLPYSMNLSLIGQTNLDPIFGSNSRYGPQYSFGQKIYQNISKHTSSNSKNAVA